MNISDRSNLEIASSDQTEPLEKPDFPAAKNPIGLSLILPPKLRRWGSLMLKLEN